MRHAKTIAILTAAVFPSVVIFCCAIAFAVYWIYDIFLSTKAGSSSGYTPSGRAVEYAPIIISALLAMSTLISTISTIWLAWRSERRGSREFDLRIEKLEMELKEARLKAAQISN